MSAPPALPSLLIVDDGPLICEGGSGCGKELVAAALELAEGNVSEAAGLPGINRATLHSRMDAHEKQPTG